MFLQQELTLFPPQTYMEKHLYTDVMMARFCLFICFTARDGFLWTSRCTQRETGCSLSNGLMFFNVAHNTFFFKEEMYIFPFLHLTSCSHLFLDEDGKSSSSSQLGKAVGNSDVWFRFNEGVSNAVRRNVYIRELL